MSSDRNLIIKALLNLEVKPPDTLPDKMKNKELKFIEEKYKILIPNEYKEFLLNYNEVFFENEVKFKLIELSPWATLEGTQIFDGFYALNSQNSISEQIDCYANRMPSSLIPIGECPGGNLICIGVKESAFGKIYFWDHENELEAKLMIGAETSTNNINLYWENLYLISETFIDFLSRLEINQRNSKDEDNNVDDVELWLDDDLLDN